MGKGGFRKKDKDEEGRGRARKGETTERDKEVREKDVGGGREEGVGNKLVGRRVGGVK